MPDSQFYTKEAATAKAAATQTALAASKLRFTQSPFIPNQFSTKAEMVAAEANFSGYTAGGYAIATWAGPDNNSGGGSKITSPAIHAAIVDPDPDPIVPNTLTGWWVETGTGVVRLSGTLDPQPTLAAVGDAYVWIRQIVEGLNIVPGS